MARGIRMVQSGNSTSGTSPRISGADDRVIVTELLFGWAISDTGHDWEIVILLESTPSGLVTWQVTLVERSRLVRVRDGHSMRRAHVDHAVNKAIAELTCEAGWPHPLNQELLS